MNRARLSEGLIVTLHHPAIVQALKPNKHSIPAIKDKDEAFSCKNINLYGSRYSYAVAWRFLSNA